MILQAHPDGLVAIAQSAHALVAFHIAAHWGNRTTPHLSPRSEVLAAVLLHDAGWDDREEPPRLSPNGLPIAFDTLPDEEREALWTAAVERAVPRGRYVEYLVSHHVAHLAGFSTHHSHTAFLAREQERQRRLRGELERDARFRQCFSTGVDELNRAVVRITDALAVHLCRAGSGTIHIASLPHREGPVPLRVNQEIEHTYRLHPWPLVGRRLELHAEGRRLPGSSFADEAELRRAWADGKTVSLRWILLPQGAQRD